MSDLMTHRKILPFGFRANKVHARNECVLIKFNFLSNYTGVKGGTPGQPNDGSQESICQKKIGKYMSLNWLNKPIMRKDVVNNI